MSTTTAAWVSGPGIGPTSHYTSPNPPGADDNGSRSSSPCRSVLSSAPTIDTQTDYEDNMATLSSRAELTHGPPIMASAKPQGGIMHTARGTSEPRRISGEEPKGAGSSKHGDNNEQAGRQQGDEKDSSGRGGDEGGGGAAQAPPALQTSDVTLRAKEGRIFACPFRKRNPLRFNIREHGECSYVGFSMADLKKHLTAFHAPSSEPEDCECPSTPEVGGRMSTEAMGKVVQIDSGSRPASRSWVVIYQIIFGDSISVPEPDWEAPIELEEAAFELLRNIKVLRERVEHEAERLIPRHKIMQRKVSSSLIHVFVFFIEQMLSSCQQRVRGNAFFSLLRPPWPQAFITPPAELNQRDEVPHDLLGIGAWSRVFHYNIRHSPQLVHRDLCAPSSLVLAVRNGDQEFFCKIDCTKQQLDAILGIGRDVDAKAAAHVTEVQYPTMEVDEGSDGTSDFSPVPVSNTLPYSDGEDSESCVSGSEDDDVMDEVVGRLCDTFLRFCGGPLCVSRANIDSVSQVVRSAMADLVLELFDQLSGPPQMNHCASDGASSSARNPGSSRGTSGASAGGAGRSGDGGYGLSPDSSARKEGPGDDDPVGPRKGLAIDGGQSDCPGPKLSCPYRKRNPQRFNIRDHKPCATTGFNTLNHVKRHVRDHHRKLDLEPHKCVRCTKGFATPELLRVHCKAIEVCQPSARGVPEEENPEDGMNAEVEKQLRSRGGKDKIRTWGQLYRALFPKDYHTPSPYYESPDSTGTSLSRLQAAYPELKQRLEQGLTPFVSETCISLALQVAMAEISTFHDENLPQDELSPLENGGKKRSYSDTQLAATPRNCPDVVVPDKRRKENLASEQDWVHIGSATARSSTKQPDLLGSAMSATSALLPPPENVGMLVTAPEAWYGHLSESMNGPSEPGMDLTGFGADMAPWWPDPAPGSSVAFGFNVGESSSHHPGDSAGN